MDDRKQYPRWVLFHFGIEEIKFEKIHYQERFHRVHWMKELMKNQDLVLQVESIVLDRIKLTFKQDFLTISPSDDGVEDNFLI